MTMNLYPEATATDTMIGCYLTRESAIGRANVYEEYSRWTVSTEITSCFDICLVLSYASRIIRSIPVQSLY